MSTEHQRYSTENQADAIRKYAEQKGLEIVRTYADEGKSGLRLDGQEGIKTLIRDVQTRKADFSTILVYDVSRWGRFQDADESAHSRGERTRRNKQKSRFLALSPEAVAEVAGDFLARKERFLVIRQIDGVG